MTIKYMLAGTIFFISTSSITLSGSQKNSDFVFNRRMFTEINGNYIYPYIHLKRDQSNPSYVFKHTRVVECAKDKKLKEIGTLGSLEKTYRSARYGLKATVDRFEKYANMNNAIYCADIEQKLNYYDELEDVGAIVYGTQDVEDCALVKEYLRQQKRAEENSKSEAKVAENKTK
jgi:hypothetical protein